MTSNNKNRDDMQPGDAALSVLHRRYAAEQMPADVEDAVLGAARRRARKRRDDDGNADGDDAELSRLHRQFSVDESPPEVERVVLAAMAKRKVMALPQRASWSQRMGVPFALAATVLIAVALISQREPVAPPIEILSSQSTREAAEWLTEIRKLADQGQMTAARDRLAKFKQRFPKQPVPDDIRAKLAE